MRTIEGKGTQALGERLSKTLAEGVFLSLQARNFHWNVTGPWFAPLHALFDTLYQEIDAANDEVAERLRALGVRAPGTFSEFSRLSAVKEPAGPLSAKKMLEEALHGQETILKTLKSSVATAQEAGDEATADLFIGRIQAHEKHAWMLRSTLEGFTA